MPSRVWRYVQAGALSAALYALIVLWAFIQGENTMFDALALSVVAAVYIGYYVTRRGGSALETALLGSWLPALLSWWEVYGMASLSSPTSLFVRVLAALEWREELGPVILWALLAIAALCGRAGARYDRWRGN